VDGFKNNASYGQFGYLKAVVW